MKTEDLQAKGLTQEQIDYVMAEYGKDINGIKQERDTYKTQLCTAQATLKSFEGVNISELQGKIQTLTTDLANKDAEYQKQLAERMNSKESTVVRLLDRMEKENMVRRVCCQDDRRVRYLEMTPEGRKLYEKLSQRAEQFKDDAIRGISEEKLEVFKEVLNQMLANTEEG